MPSGKVHEAINMTFFAGLSMGYIYARAQGISPQAELVLSPQTISLFSLSYLAGTFLVTPDLDLAEQNVRAKSHWGGLGFLWIPYGAIFNHRGTSHSWFVGPLTRLIYMTMIALTITSLVGLVLPFMGYQINFKTELSSNWRQLLIGALLGYYLSQWLHLVADGIWPDHGARRRNKNKKRKRRSKRK
ncbi:MAG TPA: hydrolase [Trueperaceae bacterium]|nr:hydrolase [Trueperaceae bacterium]